MEQTFKNMSITLMSVELQLGKHGTQEAKTLMNTYRNLLNKFYRLPQTEIEKLKIFKNEWIKHKSKIEELIKITDMKIETNLKRGLYKNADNLTVVSERLERSLRSVNDIIKLSNKEQIIK
ncbi:hypothetical protein AB0Y20_00635 [Heyndrickxia oleronia]|uniref:hypothetical protein n=1 Tax=Heyndrickxia oleronia TaxID=38875 RepID=UPI003F28C882